MELNKSTFAKNGFLQGDPVVWMVFVLLGIISIIEVYSSSSNMSYKTGDYWTPVLQHSAYLLMGFVVAWVIHLIPCNLFKIISTFSLHVIAYPLLIAALFAEKVNDAGRWFEILGIKFQPSEIAKICLVTFVAFILSTLRDEKGASKKAFWWVFTEVAITCLLIFFENASTAFIIFIVMLCICFYAQVKARYLATICGLFIGGIALIFTFAHSIPESTLDEWAKTDGPLHRVPTWVHRITDHAEKPEDPKDYDISDNVQVTHAKIAIATCNVIGKGPGNSVERDFLPQAYSDFIYAIIIEEGGILFGAFVMFLYLLLMWRAMKISKRCKALFPSYLVLGLALMMVIQAMINMAVAVGAFPVTGQPLPLISKGGTSTFVNCAYIGMILSVSRNAKKMARTEKKENEEQSIQEVKA